MVCTTARSRPDGPMPNARSGSRPARPGGASFCWPRSLAPIRDRLRDPARARDASSSMWNGTSRRCGRCGRCDLAMQARGMRGALRRDGFVPELVGECFALVREAASRTIGQRHYDAQLMAGWALLQGKLVEMETGEGKTIAATLAASTVGARRLSGARHYRQRLSRPARRRRDGPAVSVPRSERRYRGPGHAQISAAASLCQIHHLLHQQGTGLRLSARPGRAGDRGSRLHLSLDKLRTATAVATRSWCCVASISGLSTRPTAFLSTRRARR